MNHSLQTADIKADYRRVLDARKYESLEHAAERLDTSQRTIRRMIARGELTGYNLGPRMIRVARDEVDALLKTIPTVNGAA